MEPLSRAKLALGEPPDDSFDFPDREVRTGKALYRAHAASRGVWWWGSAPDTPEDGGRFDLPSPHGTCYLALDAPTALRERFGESLISIGTIGVTEVRATALSQVALPWDVVAANTASARAEGLITRELVTCDDYGLTQRWAAAFHRIGKGAILAESRFTVRPRPTALALFGAAGDDAKQVRGPLPVGRALDVEATLARMGVRVSSGFGIAAAKVISPPSS